jgi:predicted RNA-binding Zn-ribbon protein involved in translation (DUF1610 family)
MDFKSDAKIENTIKYLYYFISVLLCGFLILLSNRIIGDLDETTTAPVVENFENKAMLDSISVQRIALQGQISEVENRKQQVQSSLDLANGTYRNEKESFDNWLKTRKTLGDPSNDKEVISRTQTLDNYFKAEQALREKIAKFDDTLSLRQNAQTELSTKEQDVHNAGYKLMEKAQQKYELHVFLIRLLFVLPILIIGIFFFVRYRTHKYRPLFMGFSLFSVYAFFFGLVPYLPSYGGYVRYSVGVVMTLIGGYYAINKIRTYLEQRQAELQKSSSERSQKVKSEIAFKAFEQHICPSCGKDFIFKGWDMAKVVPAPVNEPYLYVMNYCRQCGLKLFENCGNCGQKNFVHLPHCSNCGKSNAVNA